MGTHDAVQKRRPTCDSGPFPGKLGSQIKKPGISQKTENFQKNFWNSQMFSLWEFSGKFLLAELMKVFFGEKLFAGLVPRNCCRVVKVATSKFFKAKQNK